MKFAKRLTRIATAAMCLLNIFTGANFSLIADAESHSDEIKYGDYLSYKQIDEDDDGIYDYVEIIGCDETAKEVIIPDVIDGLPVTSIGNYVFFNCTDLERIEIIGGVTEIGNDVFESCTSLTDITITDRTIDDNKRYSSIHGVLFNNNKTKLIAYPIGRKDNDYSIPETVKEIGEKAFSHCTSLEKIEIPNSVTTIDMYAFRGCTGLIDIEIPDSVEAIESYTFEGCTSLSNVKISNSTEKIGDFAFYGCTGLISVVIPDSVSSIEIDAFRDCTSLASIEIPDNVYSIGDDVFYGCTALESINVSRGNFYYSSMDGVLFNGDITRLKAYPMGKKDIEYSIPFGVKTIGYSAFSGCTNLTNIVIPESVTLIEINAFRDCANLENINVLKNNLDYSSVDGVLFNKAQTELIVYPIGKKDVMYSIPESVTSIGYNAFSGCNGLKNVKIPDSISLIGVGAFRNCTGLTSVVVPDSVTLIEINAFTDCINLTSIKVLNPECDIYDSQSTISNGHDEYYWSYFDGTIYGYENSTAQAYAEEYEYKFESLGEKPIVTTPAVTTIVTTTTTAPVTTATNLKTTVPATTVTTDKTTEPVTTTSSTTVTNATTTPVTTTTPVVTYQKGDADGDGKLSIRDAAYIAILCAKGQYDDIPECADYNGDGKRNIRDAAAIAIYCAKRSAGKI